MPDAWSPPLPADDPRAPRYWMYETSGVLKGAVERYISHRPLQPGDIRNLREYFRQWVNAEAWEMNPALDDAGRIVLARLRYDVARIINEQDISKWLCLAVSQGMDPL